EIIHVLEKKNTTLDQVVATRKDDVGIDEELSNTSEQKRDELVQDLQYEVQAKDETIANLKRQVQTVIEITSITAEKAKLEILQVRKDCKQLVQTSRATWDNEERQMQAKHAEEIVKIGAKVKGRTTTPSSLVQPVTPKNQRKRTF
ncbi:hypothetical protein EJ08DRAFT_653248, partial [Tothia fuscella]